MKFYWSLGALCLVGVFYRIPMVLLPATLSGYDPEKYALFARLTLYTGDYTLPQINFYGIAGGFHTYIAQASAITGLEPNPSMVVVGLLLGVWTPLITASFCLLISNRTPYEYQAGTLAAIIATVAAVNINISYMPIAQSFGVILFTTLLFIVIKQIGITRIDVSSLFLDIIPLDYKSKYSIIILLILSAMVVTHKIPLVIITIVFSSIWIVNRLFTVDIWPWETIREHLSFLVVFLSGLATFFQQVIITPYIDDSLLLVQTTLFTSSSVPVRTGRHPDAASVPDIGFLSLFESHSYAPITLLIAGSAWALVVWYGVIKNNRPEATVIAFMTAIATLTMFVIVSLGGAVSPEAVPPYRIYVLVEILLISVIGVGIAILYVKLDKLPIRRIITVVVIVLLMFQVFASIAAPDYPGQQREYLTSGEMTAKKYAVDHVPGDIHTDTRYARETPYPERVTEKTNPWVQLGVGPVGTKFRSNTVELVEGTAVNADHSTIMYRTHADIYETHGRFQNYRYELDWDVETTADQQYHRVYDNDHSLIYRNPTSDVEMSISNRTYPKNIQ